MDPFEQFFRWAWQFDFGETPEQTARRINKKAKRVITPAMFECDLSTSHFSISAREMLKQFKAELIKQAKKHNIDGRAVAGAIAWEYEENPRGRLSDYGQAPAKSVGVSSNSDGLGWGSMHGKEAKSLRPHLDDTQLMCARMEAAPALELIARFMDKMAGIFESESQGVYIRDQPAILAGFYQAGEPLTRRSAEKRKEDPGRESGVVTLDMRQIKMAVWVHNNLARFEPYKTTPTLPGPVIHAKIKVK